MIPGAGIAVSLGFLGVLSGGIPAKIVVKAIRFDGLADVLGFQSTGCGIGFVLGVILAAKLLPQK